MITENRLSFEKSKNYTNLNNSLISQSALY